MGEDRSGDAAAQRVWAIKAPPDRLYGRQRGQTLRARQKLLLIETLPRLRLADPAAPPTGRPLWLEVGFGGGEHSWAQINARPDVFLYKH